MSDEVLTNGKISVNVLFNTVSIAIDCGDAYEAHSLFDELVARLERGERVTLRPSPAPSDCAVKEGGE